MHYSHTHTHRDTRMHTHARFISSGNLAPIVETQPSSGYHRNRSNGSLLFVRVPSLLPPSPVATRPPQSLVRRGQHASAPFKDRLMLMINPSAELQIKQMTVLQLTVAQAALWGENSDDSLSQAAVSLFLSLCFLFFIRGGAGGGGKSI